MILDGFVSMLYSWIMLDCFSGHRFGKFAILNMLSKEKGTVNTRPGEVDQLQ